MLTNHYNEFLKKQWWIIPYTKCTGLLTSSVLTLRFRFALIKIQLYMQLNFFKFATSYFCSFCSDNQCLLGRLMRKELMFTYKLILPNLNCCTKSTRWKKVTLNKTRKCQFLKRWEFWPWMKEIIEPFLYQSLNPQYFTL